MVIVVYLCEYTNKHWTVHFKWVTFMAWELYLQKKVFFLMLLREKLQKWPMQYIKCPQNAKALCMSVAKNDAETGQARAGQI